ncbi:MAG: protease family protein [Actinomycetota bacterium]|nr:protease family protein [Actinomycetota bacterium]
MRLLIQFLAVAAVAAAGSAGIAAVQGDPWQTLGLGVATAVIAMLAYVGVVRVTERRTPVEVGLRGAVPSLVRGLLIGTALFSTVIGAIAALGGYRVNGTGSATGAAALFGFMTAAAVTEELLFRGVLFRIVDGRIGTWGALALSAVLFGLSHLTNPHASLWAATAIAIEAGVMLAAAYTATRTLWVPIGLHLGWNFAESGIFGTEVSGRRHWAGLLDGATSGSSLVSGGQFGPEASLPAVVAGTLLTIGFLVLAHRRGHLVSRRRRHPAPGEPVATLTP